MLIFLPSGIIDLCHINIDDLFRTEVHEHFKELEELENVKKPKNADFNCKTCLEIKPLRVKKLKSLAYAPRTKAQNEDFKEEGDYKKDEKNLNVLVDLSSPFKQCYLGSRYLKVNFCSPIGLISGCMTQSKKTVFLLRNRRKPLNS
jgi:hypothetical protein